MALRPVHLKLAAQGESHAVVEAAKLANGFFAVGLLLGKLVARQAQYAETLIFVLLLNS